MGERAPDDQPRERRSVRASRLYARWVVRLRIPVVAVWIVVSVGAVTLLPGLGSTGSGGLQGLIPPGSEAVRAEVASIRLFGFPLLTRTLVVQRDPSGLGPLVQARVFLRAVSLNRHRYLGLERIGGALPVTNAPQLFPDTAERSTTAITYLFFRPNVSLSARDALAHKFARLRIDRPGDSLIGVTGTVPGRLTQGREIHDTLPSVELITVLVILAIVAWHFRSAVAPCVTLMAAAISFAVTERMIPWVLGRFGIGTPSELEPLVVALLLGIVTDYSIFFLAGYRDRLRTGDPKHRAIEVAVTDVSPIVLTAGLTVAAGTGALLLARLGAFRALGPGLALTVLVGMVVSVTFVPALLALLGRHSFWPMMPTPTGPMLDERPPGRITRLIVTRRGATLVALACLLGLGLAAAEVRHVRPSFSVVTDLPSATEVRRAAAAAGEGFAPGITSPSMLVLQGPRARNLARLTRLQRLLEDQPGVAMTMGPRELRGVSQIVDRLPSGLVKRELEGEAARVLRAVVSPRHRAARLMVILERPPLTADAIEILRSLNRVTPELLDRAELSGLRFAYAGDTALALETIDRTLADLLRIALVVTIIDLLILIVFLRSLIAPVYLVLTSLLGFLAGLGTAAAAFRLLGGTEGMSVFVPFAAAVLLVSLGSDYNIFLVGQVWEEARRSSLQHGLLTAAPRASRAIATAGVTLAMSFAVLGLVPLTSFRQFATAMAAGILLDTFAVRSLLVPSMITLVGRIGAWPGRFRGTGASVTTTRGTEG